MCVRKWLQEKNLLPDIQIYSLRNINVTKTGRREMSLAKYLDKCSKVFLTTVTLFINISCKFAEYCLQIMKISV